MIDPSPALGGINQVGISSNDRHVNINTGQYEPKVEAVDNYSDSDRNNENNGDGNPNDNNDNNDKIDHDDIKDDKIPQYWNLLTEVDKNGYHNLKMAFNAGSIKRNRGHRIETFDGILDAIRRYAEQGNENDWKRFLVCGVCWMDQAIAINTRQLRLLISKCKSSINGSLQKLGFSTNTSHSESWKILFSRIPLLKDNFTEIRQWTIRYRIPPTTTNGAILNNITQQQQSQQQIQQNQQQQQSHKNNHNRQDPHIRELEARQQLVMMQQNQQLHQIMNKYSSDQKNVKPPNNANGVSPNQQQQMFAYQYQLMTAQPPQQKQQYYPMQIIPNQIGMPPNKQQPLQNFPQPIKSEKAHFIQNQEPRLLTPCLQIDPLKTQPENQHITSHTPPGVSQGTYSSLPPIQRCPPKFRVKKLMEMERKSDKNNDSA